MSPLDPITITYFRDTLGRYGYPSDDFSLTVQRNGGNHPAADSICITCRASRVRRSYPASRSQTWVLNFEEDLGAGRYR